MNHFIIFIQGKKNGDDTILAIKKFVGTDKKSKDKEANILKLVNPHSNIVKFHGYEEGILAMEFCSSGSLEQHITSTGLPTQEFANFFRQFLIGLKHLNALRVTHRDLKPENVLVVGIGENATYKIADFGAARVLKKNQRYSSLYGTAEYMHPDIFPHFFFYPDEVELPERKFKAEHEIWSVGATVFHAATGFLPFEPEKGREDPKMMYKMLTERKLRHISATETKDGLVFNSKLPEKCSLDDWVKRNLERLLVGMFKVRVNLRITFWVFGHS